MYVLPLCLITCDVLTKSIQVYIVSLGIAEGLAVNHVRLEMWSHNLLKCSTKSPFLY